MSATKTDVDRRSAVWGGLIFGVAFGGIFAAKTGLPVWAAIVIAAAAGPPFGWAIYRGLLRQRRAAVAALGPLGVTLDRSTVRNAISGPVAEDPESRQEQLRIIDFQITQMQKSGRKTRILLAAVVVLEVVLAITSNAWFWLGAAILAAVLVLMPVQLARLHRRREQLIGGDPGNMRRPVQP